MAGDKEECEAGYAKEEEEDETGMAARKGAGVKPLRYLSVCSGIEAASVAWGPLGWQAVAFAEIDKFPAALLAHHYPDVPNLGDMRGINGADFRGKIDVLVGGTPCQSFSVAGLRRGLEDERGNLALEFVRIADESAPAFVVWENVPGILSDGGNAFGCFLGALAGEDAPLLPPGGKWTNAGYVLGPRRAISWRVLDAQYFGLAQRRKRVFLIACPRNGADPRKILFEFNGLRRDTPPCRETGTGVAGTLEGSLGSSRGAGTPPGAITQALTGRMGGGGPDDNKAQGGFYVTAAFGGECSHERDIATSIGAHDRRQWETDTFIATALRAEGFDASEDGTGRQNLVVQEVAGTLGGGTGTRGYANSPDVCGAFIPVVTPINTQVGLRHKALGERTGLGIGEPGDPAFTLQGAHCHAVAFHGSQDPDVSGDVTHPLGTNQGQEVRVLQGRWRGDDGRGYERSPHVTDLPSMDAQKVDMVASVAIRGREGGCNIEMRADGTANTLRTPNGGRGGEGCGAVLHQSAVRRLTPRECERLQGFPDDYTLIPYRDKPAADCADGPRYKALGNSMAVPVMRWIGERISKYVAIHGNGDCPPWCPCSSANIPLEYNSDGCQQTRRYYAPEYAPFGGKM